MTIFSQKFDNYRSNFVWFPNKNHFILFKLFLMMAFQNTSVCQSVQWKFSHCLSPLVADNIGIVIFSCVKVMNSWNRWKKGGRDSFFIKKDFWWDDVYMG